MVGLDNVDEVIKLIKNASSHSSASAALQSGELYFTLTIYSMQQS